MANSINNIINNAVLIFLRKTTVIHCLASQGVHSLSYALPAVYSE